MLTILFVLAGVIVAGGIAFGPLLALLNAPALIASIPFIPALLAATEFIQSISQIIAKAFLGG